MCRGKNNWTIDFSLCVISWKASKKLTENKCLYFLHSLNRYYRLQFTEWRMLSKGSGCSRMITSKNFRRCLKYSVACCDYLLRAWGRVVTISFVSSSFIHRNMRRTKARKASLLKMKLLGVQKKGWSNIWFYKVSNKQVIHTIVELHNTCIWHSIIIRIKLV